MRMGLKAAIKSATILVMTQHPILLHEASRLGLRPILSLAAMVTLSACQTPPFGRAQPAPAQTPPTVQAARTEPAAAQAVPAPQAAPPAAAMPQAAAPPTAPAPRASAGDARADPKPSNAGNAKAYRADAAAHLYALNQNRIYVGRLPPNLYAIGVLDVELNARGQVLGLKWQRAPSHAPEVIEEIERTVRAAAPYPSPQRMRQVTYTDVWLWHKGGKFQLDTLTEGQD